MTQKPTIMQLLRQGDCANHGSKALMAGMLIFAGLAGSPTGLADEKATGVSAKMAAPIKDITNMQELEGMTFHVINITEHDSVLPAELRLAGTESDWAEGVCGYIDGKEVPTGLLPGDKGVRLVVLASLKSKEVKKVSFKKGKGTVASDLKMEQEGNRVVVSNGRAKWNLGPNGLEQFQRDGKTFVVKETGIANGTLKATMTPAVCRVVLSLEGGPAAREYLFYPNSSLWRVDADKKYQLAVDGSNAFYYAHPCTMFFGDPGSPYSAAIETSELEKGGAGIKGLKEFHLFSAVDWGLLMDKGIGLGVYPDPSSHTILVDTTKRLQGVFVQAVPRDERLNAIFKKWHCGAEQERMCGCGWWRTKVKPLDDIVSYVFGATTDVRDGTVQRSASLAPVVFRFLGEQRYGAQLPWVTAGRTETIYVEDLDGKGPDLLNDRWYWCDNGKPMSSFEFNDPDKNGRLDDIYIYAKWDDKGGELDVNKMKLEVKSNDGGVHANGDDKRRALDAMELKYPVCALHDQTRDGKMVVNCVFFGGRMDQDRYELNVGIDRSPPDRAMIERKKSGPNVRGSPLEVKKFNLRNFALDLDNDGDWDVSLDDRRIDDLDMDHNHIEGRQQSQMDLYDNNTFRGPLLDPLAGNLTVKCGFQWPFFLGHKHKAGFRYKGVPVTAQDAVMGNMDLDGDGLPEAKLIYDGGWFGEDYVMRPVMNMIGASLSLSDRHALSKINSWVWQEGPGCNSCYTRDITVYPIRKDAGFPWPGDGILFNDRLMPKRPIKDSITTYRDKWGNEIKIVGIMQIPGWDGKLVAGSKTPSIVKDWSDSMHYDWDYMFVLLGGENGVMTESGYPNHSSRWEFCPDYAQRQKTKLFYSELDGRLHLTGAAWGHDTPYMGSHPKKAPLDEFAKYAHWWLHEGHSCLDCDTMRYYSKRHEAFFDADHDGYLDCFLVDTNNDGWFESRAWYDRANQTVACMKDGILVMSPRQLEPYPEEELLVDTDHYGKLVALKRMSEEKAKTSYLKATTIKASPLSISVPGSNLYVGVSGDILPQVLLDASHCEAGIWCDLSPKGYSRLLTGLQRQKVVVRELKEKWSAESLRTASVLFLAPPYTTKPDTDELKALDAFLKAGGRVVVALPDWSTEPQGEIYALKANTPLIPDGKTGDWTSPLGLDLALAWDKPEPYRVKIQVSPQWDKTHFYLYVEIHDRDLINKEIGGDIWKGDCIQFALGDWGEKLQTFTPGMGQDDVVVAVRASGGKWQEYGLARNDKGVQVWRWFDTSLNRSGPVAGAKLEVKRLADRTIYQLALPWSEVGNAEVQAGKQLGFALMIWDRADADNIQCVTMGHLKRPDQFRKLIFVATPKDVKGQEGVSVESPWDVMCASYGIRRNNECSTLMAVNDLQFRNRGMGPEVWAKFKGNSADNLMKDVRKLFFNGNSLGISDGAAPLVQYQDKIIAARVKVGQGELLVLNSAMLLQNRYTCFHTYEGGDFSLNAMPIDKFIDAKPDNNVFMDNLGAYVVADQNKLKVLKAGDTQITAELAGPGQVYVNKGTKIALDGKEAISSKADGDTLCFDIPASKDQIKINISR